MKEHKVVCKKILSRYYNAVLCGDKTFELRKDEDDIQSGDVLVLREWDGKASTGRHMKCKVTYVLRNATEYGLMEGHCIISLKVIFAENR